MPCDFDIALRSSIETLSVARGGLFADIDGTISHIADRPDAATIPERANQALSALSLGLPVVALVTGRSAHDATAMTNATGVSVIGNHGFERIVAGQHIVDAAVLAAVSGIDESLAIIKSNLQADGSIDGLVFENKNLSASIHYRLADDTDAMRQRLLDEIVAVTAAHGLRVTEGRLVIEIRPAVEINKGTAITAMAKDEGLEGIVFLGDDLTDIDGFRALSDLRASGVRTASIAVVAPESNPLVEQAADYCVDGVDEAIRLLSELAGAFSTETDAQ